MALSLRMLLLAAGFLSVCHSLDASFETRFRAIVQGANRAELYEFFRDMPKGGILHLHSEYAVSPQFWLRAATAEATAGVNEYFAKTRKGNCPSKQETPLLFVTIRRVTWARLPACEKSNFKPLRLLTTDERRSWLESLELTSDKRGRQKFFQEIVPRLDELCTDPNLMLQVIPEIMEQAATEHIVYLELQFDPTSLRNSEGRPISEVSFDEMLKQCLKRVVASTDVTVRFHMAAYRYASDPHKELLNAFQFVDRHRDLWVGVNLLGEEGRPNGELSRFGSALRVMRGRYDIPFSLHAGELDTPGHEVRDALYSGASRIGHALNLISDPQTMLFMRHGAIPIETSLVSNKLLDYMPDLSTHPFPLYLRSGVPMCLNTDDPGAFGGTLTDEFFLAATLYHLSWKEIVTLVRNSIQYAFVDDESKARC